MDPDPSRVVELGDRIRARQAREAELAEAGPTPPPGRFDDGEPVEAVPVEPPPPPPWPERLAASTASWFQVRPPRRTWLLRDARQSHAPGVLPAGKVGLLIGEGGVSKTMALVALALAVATGTPWLGAFAVATMGRVLLLLGEEDFDEVHRRCYSVARATNCPIPVDGTIVALPLAGIPCAMIEKDERGNAIDSLFLGWLREALREHGPFVAVLVDPLSRFAGPDAEVDNAAATRFVQALESIATEAGATVIVAHHTNKAARAAGSQVSGASARGSSAIYDGVRWAAALSAEKNDVEDDARAHLGETVTLAIVKSNYSQKCDPVQLRRDDKHGGALVSLDDADRTTLEEARKEAAPSARRRESLADAERQRTLAAVAALRQALAGGRILSTIRLFGAARSALGHLSKPTFESAMATLDRSGSLRSSPGRRGATEYYIEDGPNAT